MRSYLSLKLEHARARHSSGDDRIIAAFEQLTQLQQTLLRQQALHFAVCGTLSDAPIARAPQKVRDDIMIDTRMLGLTLDRKTLGIIRNYKPAAHAQAWRPAAISRSVVMHARYA